MANFTMQMYRKYYITYMQWLVTHKLSGNPISVNWILVRYFGGKLAFSMNFGTDSIREILTLANVSAFWAGWVENWLGQVVFCVEHTLYMDICFRASASKIQVSHTGTACKTDKTYNIPVMENTRFSDVTVLYSANKVLTEISNISQVSVLHFGNFSNFWNLVLEKQTVLGIFFIST